jgi:hypothetical protein
MCTYYVYNYLFGSIPLTRVNMCCLVRAIRASGVTMRAEDINGGLGQTKNQALPQLNPSRLPTCLL